MEIENYAFCVTSVTKQKQIFKKNILTNINHFFKNKYPSKTLEQSLKKYFKENRLAECKKRIVVPSYNITDDDVYIFKTPHHERLRRDFKVPLWKVAMATSAAPTYFPSFNDIDNIRLIDGGIWANNPTLVGITEAISLLNIEITDIKVLNIGTTSDLKDRSAKLNNGGLCQWKYDGVNLLIHSQSIGTYNTVAHIIGKDNILRIDPVVPDGLFKIDKLNTNELIAKASTFSRKLVPEVKDKFLSHIAEKYIPLYK